MKTNSPVRKIYTKHQLFLLLVNNGNKTSIVKYKHAAILNFKL